MRADRLDLGELLGRSDAGEPRRSEVVRAVRETLLVNPYILEVSQTGADFEGAVLRLAFRLKTIYGDVGVGSLPNIDADALILYVPEHTRLDTLRRQLVIG